MRLIDSHAHLNDRRFASDLPAVLERARAAGLQEIVNVGFDLASSRRAVALAAQHPGLYAAIGVHPHDAEEVTGDTIAALRELAGKEGVVAIGETGLDYYRHLSPAPVQRKVFAQFVALAAELNLPLIIHCREAQEDTLAVLDEHLQPDQRLVMHCFSGNMAFAEACLQRGCYLGLAGPVTYPKSEELREVVRGAPLERLLIETDCPYLPPQPYRGKRNEPAYVALVGERIAAIRGLSMAEIALATSANAAALFALTRGSDQR